MTDLPRLSEDDDVALASLLRAGQSELPPGRALEKTLAALGTAVGILGATQTAAATTKVAKIGLVGLTKWAGVGLVSGFALMGTAQLVKNPGAVGRQDAAVDTGEGQRSSTSQRATPRERETPLLPTPADPHPDEASNRAAFPPEPPGFAPIAPQQAALRPSPARPSAAAIRPPVHVTEADSTVAREVELIDEARRALGAKRPGAAIEALARYRSEARSRTLGPEAQYLEMEARLAAGDQDSARRAAKALLERYPNGAHAARARWVLGDRSERDRGLIHPETQQ